MTIKAPTVGQDDVSAILYNVSEQSYSNYFEMTETKLTN